jgi:proteasome lid subunit RPN8/RPN11
LRRRIELNRNLPPVAISSLVLHELCSHAMDVVPEECCGLIAGRPDDPYRAVYRVTNVMTKKHLSDSVAFPRDAHHAYYMSEVEYQRAQQQAEEAGDVITAVYHSHVGADAYLSEDDLAYAEHPLFPFPGAAQVVLSLLAGRIETAAVFEIDRATGEFDAAGGRVLEVVDG